MTGPAVLHLVVCAAPPAGRIGELIELLMRDHWQVQVVATPTAMSWIDADAIAEQTTRPVRHQPRRPDEPRTSPKADAVLVAPATFNTINQWATGINNTVALGTLNEAAGLGLPILVSPYAKPALTNHPAYARSIQFLSEAGVAFTPLNAIRPVAGEGAYQWASLAEQAARHLRGSRRTRERDS